MEAKRRGLRIVVSDIDEGLLPGLSALEPETYFVSDARYLPLRTDSFDLRRRRYIKVACGGANQG